MSNLQQVYSSHLMNALNISTWISYALYFTVDIFSYVSTVSFDGIKLSPLKTIARTLFAGWISRSGVPSKLTSDQGRRFESTIFKKLKNLLGRPTLSQYSISLTPALMA